jgi:hypothetical protein
LNLHHLRLKKFLFLYHPPLQHLLLHSKIIPKINCSHFYKLKIENDEENYFESNTKIVKRIRNFCVKKIKKLISQIQKFKPKLKKKILGAQTPMAMTIAGEKESGG